MSLAKKVRLKVAGQKENAFDMNVKIGTPTDLSNVKVGAPSFSVPCIVDLLKIELHEGREFITLDELSKLLNKYCLPKKKNIIVGDIIDGNMVLR